MWPRNLSPTGIWSVATVAFGYSSTLRGAPSPGRDEGSTVFKCKGCTELARLVGEVEDLRKIM